MTDPFSISSSSEKLEFEGWYWLLCTNKYVEPAVAFDRYGSNGNKTLYSFIGYDETLGVDKLV